MPASLSHRPSPPPDRATALTLSSPPRLPSGFSGFSASSAFVFSSMRRNRQGILIRDIFLEGAGKTVHLMHQIHRRGAERTRGREAITDVPRQQGRQGCAACTSLPRSMTVEPFFYRWTSSIMMPSGPRTKARRRPGLRVSGPIAISAPLARSSSTAASTSSTVKPICSSP